MTPIEALHTAARRYCIEHAHTWHEKYTVYLRDNEATSEAARAIYPRYQVLEAILPEVERMVPTDFLSLDETLAWLLLAGESAQNRFTLLPNHQQGAAQETMAEERTLFMEFVRHFAVQPEAVAPLPYRRTLATEESRGLWERVKERWGAGHGYWYPLAGTAPPHVLVFYADAFEDIFGPERLHSLLSELGVELVFELNQGREPEYEIDLAWLNPAYYRTEGYWTPQQGEWLLYASHENSLTIAGEPLVSAIQNAWPEYAVYQYP